MKKGIARSMLIFACALLWTANLNAINPNVPTAVADEESGPAEGGGCLLGDVNL